MRMPFGTMVDAKLVIGLSVAMVHCSKLKNYLIQRFKKRIFQFSTLSFFTRYSQVEYKSF